MENFGYRPEEALRAIRDDGLSKSEVLSKYNAVVGVADVSLSVNRGEIFCIMGLSGSGKINFSKAFQSIIGANGWANINRRYRCYGLRVRKIFKSLGIKKLEWFSKFCTNAS